MKKRVVIYLPISLCESVFASDNVPIIFLVMGQGTVSTFTPHRRFAMDSKSRACADAKGTLKKFKVPFED